MLHSGPARPAKANLPETTERRMSFYCLAVTAAGVSVLALASPAESEIIITNKTIPIHANTSVLIDLNGDGITDFSFFLSQYTIDQYAFNNLLLTPGSRKADQVVATQGYRVAAMLRGAKIGPADKFITSTAGYSLPMEGSVLCTQNCGGKSGYSFDQGLSGNWGGGQPNRFLGVKFQIKGQTHYGWVRLTVTIKHKGTGKGPTGSFSATITEYGYESVANKSCGAGLAGAASAAPTAEQTKHTQLHPSLGMLALGSDGLPLWRREEELVH